MQLAVTSRAKYYIKNFQVVHSDGMWSAHYLGRFHVVFTDEGNHFPGFLIKNVYFP